MELIIKTLFNMPIDSTLGGMLEIKFNIIK